MNEENSSLMNKLEKLTYLSSFYHHPFQADVWRHHNASLRGSEYERKVRDHNEIHHEDDGQHQ